MSRPKRPVCEATGKERLRDSRSAKVALRAAQRQRGRASRDGGRASWTVCRSYWCSECEGYHLTSLALYE
jgi:hypothetical protein